MSFNWRVKWFLLVQEVRQKFVSQANSLNEGDRTGGSIFRLFKRFFRLNGAQFAIESSSGAEGHSRKPPARHSLVSLSLKRLNGSENLRQEVSYD